MDYKYKQLEQELSALGKVFSELGARLSEVAKDVTAPGVNPSEKLIEQISASRTSFENVRNAIHGHATAMLVSPLPKLGELVSVAAIDSLFKASAVAEETKFSVEGERDEALAILGRVLSIIHRETTDFKPLQECHAKIGELREAVSKVIWPHRHPESESIVGAKHPTTDLLHFVENLDRIDDDRWMTLETTITNSYGKPLFVAASRGKLALGAASGKPATATPEPAKPAVAPDAAKPVEKKAVAEKAPEKPAPPAPVAQPAPPASSDKKAPAPPAPATPIAADKAPQKPVAPPAATPPASPAAPVPIQATPAPAPEKKPAPPVIAAPATSTPVAAPPPPAPAPVATVVASTPAPPVVATPSAPPPSMTVVPTPVPAAPAATASNATPPASPLAVTINSLSALANATEPAEKKPATAPAPTDSVDKQRKEPRLATPPPQSAFRPEPKPQEVPEPMQQEAMQQGLAGDGSQRPQRWGFWRGNR